MQAILNNLKCSTTERQWPDYWYFHDERRLKPPTVKVGCQTFMIQKHAAQREIPLDCC